WDLPYQPLEIVFEEPAEELPNDEPGSSVLDHELAHGVVCLGLSCEAVRPEGEERLAPLRGLQERRHELL
ncbi:hypothetical protein DCD76_19225, partial [Acinetobacter baumannii]